MNHEWGVKQREIATHPEIRVVWAEHIRMLRCLNTHPRHPLMSSQAGAVPSSKLVIFPTYLAQAPLVRSRSTAGSRPSGSGMPRSRTKVFGRSQPSSGKPRLRSSTLLRALHHQDPHWLMAALISSLILWTSRVRSCDYRSQYTLLTRSHSQI